MWNAPLRCTTITAVQAASSVSASPTPDLVTYSGVNSRRCRPIVKVLSYEVSVIGL
jgi:hypothetical protein